MIPKVVHKSWHEPLAHLWSDPRLLEIQKQLAYFKFTPEARNVFRAFSLPMNEVRVVMCALSPYQKIAQDGTFYATGLAMGTPGFDTETLKSIRDALWNDYSDLRSQDLDLTLEHWHRQGVLLLNKALTVTVNTSNSREHIEPFEWSNSSGKRVFPGWQWFTSGVIKAIDTHCSSIVFVLLGTDAGAYERLISARNYIEYACHPAAKHYWYKKNSGEIPQYLDFSKSEIFNRIDEILFEIDKTKIQWY